MKPFKRSSAALYTMKKILLSIVFALITLVTAFAADLNPFAYGLKSEYDSRTHILSGEFYVNAPADAVSVYAVDASGRKFPLQAYGKVSAKGKITFSYDLLKLRIPTNTPLTWCVEVVGQNPSSPTFVNKSNRLYAPTSVDIDNNPENPNFGTVFCVDGLNGAYQKSGYTNYLSYTDGAGLYLLNADGTARKMPYQGSNVRYGYNGGVVNKPDRTRPFFGKNTEYDLNGYHAYRVRVSDDGRIFITSFSTSGHVLWEAKKECFSATTEAEWSANTGWIKVMSVDNASTVMATKERNCSTDHQYCGIYSLFEGNAETGTFIAGPNMGFDVRGSGDNLQLLMLGGCKQAIVWSTPGHYYCDEYDLGRATLWNTPPSRRIFSGHSDGVDIVNPQGVQVQYDKSGNVWLAQHRAVTTNTTLARVNRSLESTKKNNVEIGQIDHNESSHTFRRCGAIRFNEDFSQVAIASNANGNGGGFTVYPVDASTGMPIWAQGKEVNTYNNTGVSLMDFAWDYAGNLYIAADAATNGECIAIYAMPRASELASTPAASKYEFTIDCKPGVSYMVKTVCDANKGSVVCTPAEYANVVSTGVQVPSCTELTLTVTPKPTYKFINWTDQSGQEFSSSKTVTFSVSEALTLTANFEYAEYSGITWHNLFEGGEDIYDSEIDVSRNARLYFLFMAYYNAGSGAGARYASKLGDNSGEYNVINSCYTYTDELLNQNSNAPMYWLGEYIKSVIGNAYTFSVGDSETTSVRWGQALYAFFNRVGYAKNPYDSNFKKYTTPEGLMNALVAFAPTASGGSGKGEPESWRPWWTRISCNLPSTMTYADNLPVIWTKLEKPYATYDTYENDVVPSSLQPKNTPKWYKWNNVNTSPWNGSSDTHILAWRSNSITGPIVHHVSQNNMKLYATYVWKIIEESDPSASVANHDANNYDVITLMSNPRFVEPHKLQVVRKLQSGMFNTICLPFNVTSANMPEIFKDATIMEFTGVTPTKNQEGEDVTILNFTQVTSMVAGKPYLIKLNEKYTEANNPTLNPIQFTNINNTDFTLTPGTSETFYGITFHATIDPKADVPTEALILVANDRLAQTTEEGEMLGLRGYFTIDPMWLSDISAQAADGRVYLSMKKPATTSIPVAPEAEQQTKPEVRKVMYNGQIYILRGNEVYTITGHRVK